MKHSLPNLNVIVLKRLKVLGWTQRRLAKEARALNGEEGFSNSTVDKICAGGFRAQDKIDGISEALGISLVEEALHANGCNSASVDLSKPRPEGSIQADFYDEAKKKAALEAENKELRAELADIGTMLDKKLAAQQENTSYPNQVNQLLEEKVDDILTTVKAIAQSIYEDKA